jgi:HlyD family secretion protein
MIENASSMDRPIERTGSWILRRKILLGCCLSAALVLIVAAPATLRRLQAKRTVAVDQLRLASVTRGPFVRDAVAQGKVVAALHPTLFSPASGTVVLKTRAGAAVTKGELLAQVESPELRSRWQQELATLRGLESGYSRQQIALRQTAGERQQRIELLVLKRDAAQRALARAEQLRNERLLGATDYEQAVDDLRIVELELANARESASLEAESQQFELRDRDQQVQRQRAVVAELQRQLDELSLRAPFDGMVASIDVQNRDAVAVNAPILGVVNLDAYEIEMKLTERDAADAAPGTSVTIEYENRSYPGKVVAVSPEVRDSQVTGIVAFDGAPPDSLRQNQRVTVRLVFESRQNVVQLARGGFVDALQGRKAYVVTGREAVLRDIELGSISVGAVEVVRGLAPDEVVVISDCPECRGAERVLLLD